MKFYTEGKSNKGLKKSKKRDGKLTLNQASHKNTMKVGITYLHRQMK